MEIDLMIFCLKDSDIKSQDVGIEIPLEDCDLHLFTFYNIDNISVNREDSRYTTISSGGNEFVCNEKYEIVKKRIRDLKNLMFN